MIDAWMTSVASVICFLFLITTPSEDSESGRGKSRHRRSGAAAWAKAIRTGIGKDR